MTQCDLDTVTWTMRLFWVVAAVLRPICVIHMDISCLFLVFVLPGVADMAFPLE